MSRRTRRYVTRALAVSLLAGGPGCEGTSKDSDGAASSGQTPPTAADTQTEAVALARDLAEPTAVAATDARVFFADHNAVRSAAPGGGEVQLVAQLPGPVTALAASDEQLFIATSTGLYRARAGALERVSGVQSVRAMTVRGDRLWILRDYPASMPVDTPGTPTAPTTTDVPHRSPLSGTYEITSGVGKLAAATRVVGAPSALAVDEHHAYYVRGGHIRRRGTGDEPKDEAWVPVGPGYVAVAVDDTHVYWGDAELDAVLRRPKDDRAGAQVELVAAPFGVGGRIAVDHDALVVADIDASLRRIDKTSKSVTALRSVVPGTGTDALGLAVTAKHVFVTVHRWNTRGPVVVNDPAAPPPEFQFTGQAVSVARPLQSSIRADAPQDLKGLGGTFTVEQLRGTLPAPPEGFDAPPPKPAKPLDRDDPEAFLPNVKKVASADWVQRGVWGENGFVGIREAEGKSSVLRWPVPGAQPVEVWSTTGRILALAASPDRGRVALTTADSQLVVIEVGLGKARTTKLGALGDFPPVWSPEGHSIAVANGNGISIHDRRLRSVRRPEVAALPSPLTWNDRGLFVDEWDDGDPDWALKWIATWLLEDGGGTPKKVATEDVWFTAPDRTVEVQATGSGVRVRTLDAKGTVTEIAHSDVNFGRGGALSPRTPTWVGPHHLVLHSNAVDLVTGSITPIRTGRYVEVMGFSPGGQAVIIRADEALWWGKPSVPSAAPPSE